MGSYVLTEEDYIDWLSSESSRPPAIRAWLAGCNLLSLGHSARDWSQRALLRSFRDESVSRREDAWAVARNPSSLTVMTWQRYDLEPYNVDLNEWTARMRDAVPI